MIDAIFINEDVWEKLVRLADEHKNYDTGGILLGEKNTRLPIVTDLSDPGPAAEGSQFSFQRDDSFMRAVLAETIVHSLGRIDYIGEWYLSAGGNLMPTSAHNRMLSRISTDARYNNRHPVLLLASLTDKGLRARAFIYENKKKPRKININIVRKLDE